MLDENLLHDLIKTALVEDIGAGDVTSQLLIPKDASAVMRFVAREKMVACATFIPGLVYGQLLPPPLRGRAGAGGTQPIESGRTPPPNLLPQGEEAFSGEGRLVSRGTILATVTGDARVLLAGERVALNLMQRTCGVATLTRAYVEAVKGTKAVILDTRKTMPGMRLLDKYAVTIGGGMNHRMGLYDMVLIKDNHIEIGMRHEGRGVRELISQVRQNLSSLGPHAWSPMPIIVECDTLEQVREALAAKPDRILLDNMSLAQLREAVTMSGGHVPLEASGGVSLETVRGIAETGVDYISVGKITHSASAADIGADIEIG